MLATSDVQQLSQALRHYTQEDQRDRAEHHQPEQPNPAWASTWQQQLAPATTPSTAPKPTDKEERGISLSQEQRLLALKRQAKLQAKTTAKEQHKRRQS